MERTEAGAQRWKTREMVLAEDEENHGDEEKSKLEFAEVLEQASLVRLELQASQEVAEVAKEHALEATTMEKAALEAHGCKKSEKFESELEAASKAENVDPSSRKPPRGTRSRKWKFKG